jgi:N-methylhydantoinase A
MLMSDVIKDYSYTVMRNQFNSSREELSQLFESLEEKGINDLASEGISEDKRILERYLDMRYEGQSYEIIVPFEGDYIENFHRLHEKTYGYRNEDKVVEVVNIRLRARGIPEKPRFAKHDMVGERPEEGALLGKRDVVFEHRRLSTAVYARDRLKSGNVLQGPAIVVEYSSTIVIPPFARARMDEYRNLLIDVME